MPNINFYYVVRGLSFKDWLFYRCNYCTGYGPITERPVWVRVSWLRLLGFTIKKEEDISEEMQLITG